RDVSHDRPDGGRTRPLRRHAPPARAHAITSPSSVGLVSNRAPIAIAIAIVVVFLVALSAVVMRSSVGGQSKAEAGTGVAEALDGATAARAPVAGLTEVQLALGERCLKVAIADENNERIQGLRDVTDLGGYDGMLFVYGSDTDARFTMAGTPLPLDITWYAAD